MKSFVLFENHRNAEEGIILCQKRCFQAYKVIFFSFCSIPGGKYRIAMTCSLLERKFLWSHVSKTRTANNFKFCMFTSIIDTIIGSKFQINPITVTLISMSGPKSIKEKNSWSPKKNSGKWQLFDETISLPDPKFYPRIDGDWWWLIMWNYVNNISFKNVYC